jgi:hypothetical protein
MEVSTIRNRNSNNFEGRSTELPEPEPKGGKDDREFLERNP